ncbi:hypothetical protein [Burkholderia vietnamiensis]|uniref:hypothetical protein n=1 Tax=Burkholderia vietnamiensis TaxID=60552 RepID=UPI001CF2CB34|nr:hypothetical protein [Burkholderia vietnamiensis]MCA8448867.1 hypothetical protein [Burkholderia vietnamiensis]
MRIVRTLVMSTLALGAGSAALTGTANGSTPFTLPTSIATVEQDANAVCERAPNAAVNVGLPALADSLSTTCASAVQSVDAKLAAGLGDGGSALVLPQDGRPILARVATMTANIGARVRSVQ